MPKIRKGRPTNFSTSTEVFDSAQRPSNLKRERVEDYTAIYSNNAQVSSTLYDIRIHFNDVVAVSEGQFALEELTTVIISPENCRDLHAALGATLASYETRFGPLRGIGVSVTLEAQKLK